MPKVGMASDTAIICVCDVFSEDLPFCAFGDVTILLVAFLIWVSACCGESLGIHRGTVCQGEHPEPTAEDGVNRG